MHVTETAARRLALHMFGSRPFLREGTVDGRGPRGAGYNGNTKVPAEFKEPVKVRRQRQPRPPWVAVCQVQ